MSGEKCAKAHLEQALQVRLKRVIKAKEELEEIQANIKAVNEDCQTFEDELMKIIKEAMETSGTTKVEEFLPQSFESYKKTRDILMSEVDKCKLQLRALTPFIRKAKQAGSQLEEMVEALDNAGQAMKSAQKAQERIRTDFQKLESIIKSVWDDLPESVAKGRSQEFARKEQCRKFHILVSKWEHRLNSEPHLHWVTKELDVCLKEGRRLADGSQSLSSRTIEELESSLSDIDRKARNIDLRNRERWEIARRIDKCLASASFQRISPSPIPERVGAEPICYEHRIDTDSHKGVMSSAIPFQGRINLVMMGDSEQRSIMLGSNGEAPYMENCGKTIEDIIFRLKEAGVVVTEVLWQPPDNDEKELIWWANSDQTCEQKNQAVKVKKVDKFQR